MWHASVMMKYGDRMHAAMRALEGVGDPALGEWVETHSAVHIKRRLSMQEQITSGLQMIDMRGTEQGKERIMKIAQVVPQIRPFSMNELHQSSNAELCGPSERSS